ncbi:MAG: thioredoxin family protein [Elusimicrobia bacterium]|nr:thioredoxin family protein [Elusimicrobiota bacterium]
MKTAPDFSLPGVDGKTYALASFKDAKALVVVFSCNHCPYVQAYEGRMIELQKDYAARGVRLVAINSNDAVNYPDDSFDAMKARAEELGFNFPYLHDESQQAAKAYGATHTPHLFVFGPDRRLAYTGKIDDNWQEPAKVTKRFLRDALEDLLAGKPVREPETHAIGCTIKWKR